MASLSPNNVLAEDKIPRANTFVAGTTVAALGLRLVAVKSLVHPLNSANDTQVIENIFINENFFMFNVFR
jgi:hypothetical protein